MKKKEPTSGKEDDRRRDRRSEVATVILVAPDGHENRTVIYDMSCSGAKIGLPLELDFGLGAGVRLHFPRVHGATITLGAKIVRIAIDHLGVEFGPGQEKSINELLIALSPD